MLSSVANFLSSLTAAIAVSSETAVLSGTAVLSEMSGLSEKGIPCSLTAVLRNALMVVVIFSPSSLKICSACSFKSLSILIFRFVVAIFLPDIDIGICKSLSDINTMSLQINALCDDGGRIDAHFDSDIVLRTAKELNCRYGNFRSND